MAAQRQYNHHHPIGIWQGKGCTKNCGVNYGDGMDDDI
jgi:hypothetical protein